MSVKPIRFTTDEVRATLDGRKTVKRLAVKDYDKYERLFGIKLKFPIQAYKAFNSPCEPGDILWVRETWNFGYIETSDVEGNYDAWFEEWDWRTREQHSYLNALSRFWYKADEDDVGDVRMPWRPSIHMPREAARIWLRVTDVRVEQLQEISYENLQREGGKSDFYKVKRCRACGYGQPHYPECDYEHCDNYEGLWKQSFLPPFMKLWDSTIKPVDRDRYGWAANPWVWVIAFERCEKPEEG